jgi:hypothetical protein
MHCPKCGQKQFSADAHFCKNCGFSLDRVKELLIGDNLLPSPEKESQKPGESPRRKGVRQGFRLLLICLVLAVLTALVSRRANPLPMLFFMAGILRILYAVIFQAGTPRKKKHTDSLPFAPIITKQLGTATRGSALPPLQRAPFAAFNTRRVDTAEMVRPPSVTEHTTRLLSQSRN